MFKTITVIQVGGMNAAAANWLCESMFASSAYSTFDGKAHAVPLLLRMISTQGITIKYLQMLKSMDITPQEVDGDGFVFRTCRGGDFIPPQVFATRTAGTQQILSIDTTSDKVKLRSDMDDMVEVMSPYLAQGGGVCWSGVKLGQILQEQYIIIQYMLTGFRGINPSENVLVVFDSSITPVISANRMYMFVKLYWQYVIGKDASDLVLVDLSPSKINPNKNDIFRYKNGIPDLTNQVVSKKLKDAIQHFTTHRFATIYESKQTKSGDSL